MKVSIKKGISLHKYLDISVLSLIISVLIMVFVTSAMAQEEESDAEHVVFSKQYVREAGEPHIVEDGFSISSPDNYCVLHIQNGADDQNRVSSAVVSINGEVIVATNELNQQVGFIHKPVTLKLDNTITVLLEGEPGGFITVTIIEVTQTLVMAIANPASGYAPLNVNFSATVLGAATLYEWDFNGDGVYDYSSASSANATHTYDASGIYTANIRVTDTSGATVVSSIGITVLQTAQPSGALQESDNLEQIVFSKKYVREESSPFTVEDSFSVSDPNNTCILRIQNGEDGENRISSAVISINGNVIVGPNQFNQNVDYIEIPVTLEEYNTIVVEVRSKPEGFIILNIVEIVQMSVVAMADPTSGYAPLGVSFSAIVTGDIAKYEWDFEGDGTYDYVSTSSANTSHTYMIPGTYNPTIQVTDTGGNTAIDSIQIIVEKGVKSLPTAYPTDGAAPLRVKFTAAGTSTTGTIEHFYWDFDGNGTWDKHLRIPDIYYHTYYQVGVYNAALKVVDSYNQVDIATVTVNVSYALPTATASASPTNGPIPLTVNFSGSGSSPNGAITKYEWDFDGDGTYDWESPSTASTSYTYNTVGTFNATLRVTDVVDQTDTAIVVIRAQPVGSPTVTVTANPTVGNSPLTVNFTGSATSPNGAITMYEWDFDNDGVFDWSSATTGNTSHTYNKGGVFDALLKVTDEIGVEGFGSVRVTVNVILSLSVNPTGFNPTQGETTTVRTSYSGAAAINILVKDKDRNVIRYLVSGEDRNAGQYDDVWDGRDDGGLVVPDGAYYFVAEAIMPGGLTLTYDITDTTGGGRRDLGGWRVTMPSNFAPYEDQFCSIGYNIPKAGEVSFYIYALSNEYGQLLYDIREKTIFERVPHAIGSYTAVWDGTNDQGQLVRVDWRYIVTIWSWDLPDNGVVVKGASPIISNVSAEPNYYDPSYHADEPVGFRDMTVSYNLSEAANVTLRVYESNSLVRAITHTNVPAGSNTFIWDGRNEAGELVVDKEYCLGIKATDTEGNSSPTMYALLALFY